MENFVVSARKYRPATFASVVGQDHITSTLKNAIERGQLAHAYLFCGPRGVGKTTCARIFAKAINCLHPVGAEACNECESCRMFNENRSLNIHELDAASNNSVDDIRNLIDQVRIIPQVGRYSVFIIDEVHMLSQQAFNAFLKTLEEPPAHAIFILATTEKHKIIPTILSRCQIYDFNRIRVEDAVGYLRYIAGQEGIEADDESLNLIARKADGGMRDALSMFDKAVSFCGTKLDFKEVAQTLNVLDYDTYFQMTDLLLAGNYVDALLLFDRIQGNGFSAQTFMSGLNQHMRDLLVAKGPAISLIEFTGTLLERYRSQAERCDNSFLFGAMSLLTDADGRLRQSSNQRLLVELGLMKIAALGQKKNEWSAVTDASYSLPDLRNNTASRTAGTGASGTNAAGQQKSAGADASVRTPSPTPSPAPSPTTVSRPVGVTGETKASDVRTPSQTGSTARTVQERPAAARTMSGAAGKPLVSGASIASLINGPAAEEKSADIAVELKVDPASEEKLTRSRDNILRDIVERRPRFIVAFETMRFEGNVIHLTVPSEALKEEIMHSSSEMLLRIAGIAGVAGTLELDIAVSADNRKMRPIRLEDRIKHMENKNPLYAELKKALDLEVE